MFKPQLANFCLCTIVFGWLKIITLTILCRPPISSLLKINFPTLWIWHFHGSELMCYSYLPLLHLDKIEWLTHCYGSHQIYCTADTFFRNTAEDPRQNLWSFYSSWTLNRIKTILKIKLSKTGIRQIWNLICRKNCQGGEKEYINYIRIYEAKDKVIN